MTTPAGKFVYATNFRFGTVEVFDSHFNLVKSFTDPGVPAGFAPFGIHNIGGNLFVTFEAPTSASPFFHRSLEVARTWTDRSGNRSSPADLSPILFLPDAVASARGDRHGHRR